MMNAFIQEHDLFPAALPFHTGRLCRDNHNLYFEECGKKTGRPILFLHGGPGAGIAPSHRRLFNPDRFRCVYLISVDQVSLVRLPRSRRTPQNY